MWVTGNQNEQKALSKKKRFLLGFSLIELMVVVVLIGLLIAISIPTMNALTGAEMKNELTRIAGMMSELYDRAALSGKTQRIVFDLDNNQYWAEEKTNEIGTLMPELGFKEAEEAGPALDERDKQIAKYRPSFKAIEGKLGEKIALKKNLHMYGAWTEDMNDIARSGPVMLYFFSGGYTQEAFISLSLKDENESALYVSISPLTGDISTGQGEPDIKNLAEEKSD